MKFCGLSPAEINIKSAKVRRLKINLLAICNEINYVAIIHSDKALFWIVVLFYISLFLFSSVLCIYHIHINFGCSFPLAADIYFLLLHIDTASIVLAHGRSWTYSKFHCISMMQKRFWRRAKKYTKNTHTHLPKTQLLGSCWLFQMIMMVKACNQIVLVWKYLPLAIGNR